MSDVAAVRGLLGAAVRRYRTLGRPRASSLLRTGLAVVGVAVLCFWFPRLVAYPVVHFVAGDQPIDAVVFPIDGIRQSPASPVDGRPMKRADAAEIEALLEGEAL